jgi:hypothetical protein
MHIVLLVFLSLLAASEVRAAGPLAPTRPSEIVTLAASFEPPGCPGGGAGARLDTRVTPEGTYVPLVVPPKRVLVLTEVRWLVDTTPDVDVAAVLRPGPETGGFVGVILPSGHSNASGRASGEAKFDPGIVLGSPDDFCIRLLPNGGSLTTPGNLSGAGFFAKDK